MKTPSPLIDNYGRRVSYVRMSVTDRCDFRCMYCMAEDMTFLPRSEVLSLEEFTLIAKSLKRLGVEKIRITGGEPLIRKNVLLLFQELGALGFKDLSLTTNGARLDRFAADLVQAGVHRVNISLDTLNADRFHAITRTGKLNDVLRGISAAKDAGFERIKINSVILQNHNIDEVIDLAEFAIDNGIDISYIEEMPLGTIDSHQRNEEFVSSAQILDRLSQKIPLNISTAQTGGPSRYWQVQGKPSRIGFISPHSNNFCSSCNRIRLTAEGRLLMCLGNEHSIDLRKVLRSAVEDQGEKSIEHAIRAAIHLKPKQHHFEDADAPQIVRFMNTTGG